MLCLAGLDRKSYWNRLRPWGSIPEVKCPDPACRSCLLRPHGWYQRYLGSERVAFRRVRCPRCGVTHALLPTDVCAYQDLTLTAVERAMEARAGPAAAARAAGEHGGTAIRRARRWLRSPIWKQLTLLLPAVGDLWERIVAVVGPGAEKLVRLRSWLWSKWGYLLGGPIGIFRQGRPCLCLRGRST